MNVYKYRSGAGRDLKALEGNWFWASTAEALNDPTEAYVSSRQIEEELKILEYAAKKAGLVATSVREELLSLLNMRRTMGVYSLVRTPLDELMWAYYANSHEGFCIEYDLDRLVLEARTAWNVVQVRYYDSPPTLRLQETLASSGEALDDLIGKLIGTKSARWKHEQEVRIVTNVSGQQYYASAALTGVYFGTRCTDALIAEVRAKLRGRDVAYFKVGFSADAYTLKAVGIPYDVDVDGEKVPYMAAVESGAMPGPSVTGDRRTYAYAIEQAIDIVRRDASCAKVLYSDVCTNTPPNERARIYVCYETRVPTQFSNVVKRYFLIDQFKRRNSQP